jgi:1,2-diacylglycerol 3-alpha-glucosyltransferase
MKIALVSTGLGRVLRGFESFTESLFQALRKDANHIDVSLFQSGGGSGDHRFVVPNFHRFGTPARWFGYEKGNLLEKRSFALALYPILRRGHYDIVHYNELTMGSALYHLRRLFGGKYKLLYCNGAPSPPIHYHHRCDFAQMLTLPMYEEARVFGLSEERLFLIPYGVDGDRFSIETRSKRLEILVQLGIPKESRVVLTVAALKREHKRLDYLIKEIAKMGDSVWLLAAGQRTDETRSLEMEAERLLGGRWRFVSWPHETIHFLYGAADIFVLTSLTEGLPIVLLEAMASGLPIITHDGPLYRWVLGKSKTQIVDMTQEGSLTKAIGSCNSPAPGTRDEALRRFSWKAVIPHYLKMYEQVTTRTRTSSSPRRSSFQRKGF